jgi:hypothetical protein
MKSLKKLAAGGVFATALLITPSVSADPAFVTEPVNQASLPGQLLHNPMAIKWNPEGPNKSVSITESEGVPGGQAISFRVRRKSNKPWDIRMRAPFERDVTAGQQVDIFFWARASKLPRKAETGKITVALGRNEEPYDTVVNADILPTSDWQMYRVFGVAERDFPVSESDMGFNFGFDKQTIELGPFFAVAQDPAAE